MNPKGYYVKHYICTFHVGNYIKGRLRELFRPLDKEAVSECRRKLQEVVKRVDAILESKTTKYLSGSDTDVGVADIALASLMAPIVEVDILIDSPIIVM